MRRSLILNGVGQSVLVTRFGGKEEGNMNYLIDDITRILAGPTPRRKALKLIGGVLAGGLFGAASGQVGGGAGNPSCQGVARGGTCPDNDMQQCCGQFCLGQVIGNPPASAACCPNTFACPPTRCCGDANGTGFTCCPAGTCFNVHFNASASCQSVGGAVPTACTTDTSLCA